MEKPLDWPRSPLFLENTPDAIKRQKAFYQRCYGNSPRENLNDRVLRHMDYLDYVSVPEQHRKTDTPKDTGKDYSQLLIGLEDL